MKQTNSLQRAGPMERSRENDRKRRALQLLPSSSSILSFLSSFLFPKQPHLPSLSSSSYSSSSSSSAVSLGLSQLDQDLIAVVKSGTLDEKFWVFFLSATANLVLTLESINPFFPPQTFIILEPIDLHDVVYFLFDRFNCFRNPDHVRFSQRSFEFSSREFWHQFLSLFRRTFVFLSEAREIISSRSQWFSSMYSTEIFEELQTFYQQAQKSERKREEEEEEEEHKPEEKSVLDLSPVNKEEKYHPLHHSPSLSPSRSRSLSSVRSSSDSSFSSLPLTFQTKEKKRSKQQIENKARPHFCTTVFVFEQHVTFQLSKDTSSSSSTTATPHPHSSDSKAWKLSLFGQRKEGISFGFRDHLRIRKVFDCHHPTFDVWWTRTANFVFNVSSMTELIDIGQQTHEKLLRLRNVDQHCCFCRHPLGTPIYRCSHCRWTSYCSDPCRKSHKLSHLDGKECEGPKNEKRRLFFSAMDNTDCRFWDDTELRKNKVIFSMGSSKPFGTVSFSWEDAVAAKKWKATSEYMEGCIRKFRQKCESTVESIQRDLFTREQKGGTPSPPLCEPTPILSLEPALTVITEE